MGKALPLVCASVNAKKKSVRPVSFAFFEKRRAGFGDRAVVNGKNEHAFVGRRKDGNFCAGIRRGEVEELVVRQSDGLRDRLATPRRRKIKNTPSDLFHIYIVTALSPLVNGQRGGKDRNGRRE